MLTREENELLCRVGPSTPMGAALRRYWLPAHQVPWSQGNWDRCAYAKVPRFTPALRSVLTFTFLPPFASLPHSESCGAPAV